MALSDCEKCWETPCTCGWEYLTLTPEQIRDRIYLLQAVLLVQETPILKAKPRDEKYDAVLKFRKDAR